MSPAAAINATILFYTGMRPIELYCLAAADVDPVARWIVRERRPKTGERRGVSPCTRAWRPCWPR
jgi:integrase/recombinase XerD